MLVWLEENMGTILVSLGLAAIVAAILWSMRKDRKKGKHACCGDCAQCGMCQACHQKAHAGLKH